MTDSFEMQGINHGIDHARGTTHGAGFANPLGA